MRKGAQQLGGIREEKTWRKMHQDCIGHRRGCYLEEEGSNGPKHLSDG